MTRKVKIVVSVALLSLAVIGYAARGRFGGARASVEPAPPDAARAGAVSVILGEVASRAFEESIRVQANLEARKFAIVSLRLPGLISDVFVNEGDEVVAGQTRLFRIDSLRLERAVDVARQELKVAESKRREKEAYVEQVNADLRKAEIDLKRSRGLFESKVVSSDELEARQADYDRFVAMAKHSVGLLDVEREEESKSAASLAIAEKDLADAVSIAPLTGRVTRRMAEPGETGVPGTPVLRVEDVSALDVSAWLPGQYYVRIEPGVTQVSVRAPGLSAESTVSYKSPTVEASLRTFEIKCPLSGDGKCAVPGALVDATVVLTRRDGLAVPIDAVQERAGRKVIFLADGDTARLVPVTSGLETDGFVEVSGDGLSAGSRVVLVGQFMLEDGSPIVAREENR